MELSRRAGIVAVYVLVFWGALPLGLWTAGSRLDGWLGWPWQPMALGWLPLLAGAGFLCWGMAALWFEGKGLPVSALPPPRLAVHGPYRWVRHPIYLGFSVGLLGAAATLGSPGLGLVALAFVPLWVAYARAEERGLSRRFGAAWARYCSRVGLWPGLPWFGLARLVAVLLPVTVSGQVPPGPVILVANHACYLDFLFLGRATRRRVWFPTTAEAWRSPVARWFLSRLPSIPNRRYRPDVACTREVFRLLAEGEVVGVFAERERSVTGSWLGATPEVKRLLARAGVPVVPVGISGNYDAGPRWSDVLRWRPVTVRVGAPLRAADELDAAMRQLLEADPQRVHLDGLPLAKLGRVLWRCPACLGEWSPPTCARCGGLAERDGALVIGGVVGTLGELAARVHGAPELPELEVQGVGSVEDSPTGTPAPLRVLGPGHARVGPGWLRFTWDGGELEIVPRSVSTERADTLQAGHRGGMFQLRCAEGSVFRLQRLLSGTPT